MVLLSTSAAAAPLGIVYYHETMMGDHGTYIHRGDAGIRQDMSEIAQFTDHIKLYFNPFTDGNLDHVEKVARMARDEGLDVSVVANVEDRLVGYHNLGEMRNRVLDACSRLDEASSIQVANEISLHTTMSIWEMKPHLVDLMYACEDRTNAEVGYQAFWYEKEAWADMSDRIHFTMYEEIENFRVNVEELGNRFSTSPVGEFGEDLYAHGSWRGWDYKNQQLRERYALLDQNTDEVVYAFAWREPSSDGFGLLREDKPSAFLEENRKSDESTNEEPTYDQTAQWSCEGTGCSYQSEWSDGCEWARYSYNGHTIEAQACDKGDHYEVYRKSGFPDGVKLCFQGACVDRWAGFAETSVSSGTRGGTVDVNDAGTIFDLPLTLTADAQIHWQGDGKEGSCRRTQASTSAGDVSVLSCPKDSGFEMYVQKQPSSSFKVCLGSTCVDQLQGFARGTLTGSDSGSDSTDSGSGPTISPSGSLVRQDLGTCSSYEFDTNDGRVRVQTCDKGDAMEAYFQEGPENYQVCFSSNCVSRSAGFARWSTG